MCNGWGNNAASRDFVVYFLYRFKCYILTWSTLPLVATAICLKQCRDFYLTGLENRITAKSLISSMIEKKGTIFAVFSVVHHYVISMM
jgi:hypothetical protein